VLFQTQEHAAASWQGNHFSDETIFAETIFA
jgi:hypothetical protein